MADIQNLTNIILQQAKLFLLEAGAFYPFGSYIKSDNQIVPVAAYINDQNDNPASLDLIQLLEERFKQELINGTCLIAAIAIDVTVTENGQPHDAVQLRFFEGGETNTKHFKYIIENNTVEIFQ